MKKISILVIVTLFAITAGLGQNVITEKGSQFCSHKKASNPDNVREINSPNSPKHTFDVLNYTLDFNLLDNFQSPILKHSQLMK